MEFDLISTRAHTQDTADKPGRINPLLLAPKDFSDLAFEAFKRVSFTFTEEHLRSLIRLAGESSSTENDRLVLATLLRNAAVASQGVYPLCQDTGIATVFGWQDSGIACEGDPRAAITDGIHRAWQTLNLRNSTFRPDGFFDEADSGDNLPAQILLQCVHSLHSGKDSAFRFLFCAKGGGSSNKTSLFQANRALLEPDAFRIFLEKQIPELGTAACPPYTIAVVAGGLSPEHNLLTLKLVTTGYFDTKLDGWDYRVAGVEPERAPEIEQWVLDIAARSGLGAQFGGTALASAARVYRLPRHGASFPVSIGVSCSAHRNLHGLIDKNGLWLERTCVQPERLEGFNQAAQPESKPDCIIDFSLGMEQALSRLSGLATGTAVLLNGTILVARDAAHARWHRFLADTGSLPDYVSRYPIFYAGPAKTPQGGLTGSLGPTTAGRMDGYAGELMSRGASLITIAKGNRSKQWSEACGRWNAVYLAAVGGAAAELASRHILSSTILDYADLGMEAVRLIEVRDFPAMVVINGRGEDFYKRTTE